jgi:pantoate--beta-alanine ligase
MSDARTRGPVMLRTAAEVRDLVASWRATQQTVAFVPTMGNLHAGHLSLATLASRAGDRVMMSIFVNPTQFGPTEDFQAYPRTPQEDLDAITASGVVDAVFVPDVAEIYPFGIEESIRFVLPALANDLCGAHRPGHFDGVAAVVARLLNIVAPDVLVLGRKDYQQWVLVQRMITDLRMPIRLITGATQREPDGLAMSSRNRYLGAEERARAPELYATLQSVRSALLGGEADYERLEQSACARLQAAGFKPDYVAVRVAGTLERPAPGSRAEDLVVLAAAWLGKARLIDNLEVRAA